MRVVILGSEGQLGSDLHHLLSEAQENVISLGRNQLDVTHQSSLQEALAQHHPDVVINCSVYHPVDACETRPDLAFAVNALAIRDLGVAAEKINAAVVHFSSDYVFDGKLERPYREDDTPRPLSVFGASKLAGEQLLQQSCSRHFIIRTSGLYGLTGSRVKRGNFVETMLRLGARDGRVRVVDDLRMAQTSTRNVARQTLALIPTQRYGLYHASDHGDYSWFEFAERIFKYAEMTVKMVPMSSSEISGTRLRPRYSVLENQLLLTVGLDRMQPIDVALQEYLAARQSIARGAESTGYSASTAGA